MLGYTTGRFIINWVVILLVLVTGAAAAFGYNSITGSFDLFMGFGEIGSMLGGLPSIGGILLLLIALAAVFFGLSHIARNDHARNANLIGLLGVVVLFAVAILGVGWINFSANFWPTAGLVLAVVVLVTVATAIVTPRTTVQKITTTTSAV